MLPRMALTAVLILSCGAAHAAVPKSLGTYEDWSVWTYQDNGSAHCYIYSAPKQEMPASLNHGDVSFFVRMVGKTANRTEASLTTGYDLAANSTVKADVDGKDFSLMVGGPNAWLSSAAQEADFLAALKRGEELKISAKSRRGNSTNYIFSLNGVTAAMNRMQSACP